MLALGHQLREAGHSVVFAVPPNYLEWLSRHGFAAHGVGADYQKLVLELTSGTRRAFQVLSEQVPLQFASLEPLVKEADLVVGASLNYATTSLAEQAGIPHRVVVYSVGTLPSRSHPLPLVPWQGLPKWLNRLTWWLGGLAGRLTILPAINAERKRRGLGPIGMPLDHLLGEEILLAFEPAFAPVPPDFKRTVLRTGAWIYEDDQPLPAEVEQFLKEGPPPFYVGFGSMPDRNAARTTRIIVEAAEAAKQRVILSAGWAKLGGEKLPSTVLAVGPVPHAKLFGRCVGVVHHGGAGTTTTAALTGVPQLLVPHETDQFFHAARLHALGLTPAPISKRKLTAERLAAAFTAMDSPALRARAETFSQRMIRDGAVRAVRELERVQGLGGQRG